jgi:hypothetical protein
METIKNATWSVIRTQDAFGYGYLAQDSQFDNEAEREGWEVLFTGMYPELACKFADIYRRAGCPQTELTASPDLSNLLTWDMTAPVEERVSESAEEFDLVSVEYNGRMIEGVITFFDEDTVELDGFIEIPVSHFLANATLIAKADADCGFVTEYTAYLTEQKSKWDNLVNIATETQTRMAA